jgi:sialate O-acetylesterase
LTGKWQYRVGVTANPLPDTTFFQYKPLGLYNGMIAPLTQFTIKGITWYQGESNIRRAWDYEELLTELIHDWRKKWNQGSLPFLYVQLSNYLEPEDFEAKRGWPEIREAQRKVLSVPDTGMAVTIDVGEWNDLHPLNKKAVGSRLALVARKIAYGEDTIVSSGPIYKSMTAEGNRLIIHFENAGGKPISEDGEELRHFEIAGADEEFIKAWAIIVNDNVVVWNDLIDNPVAVRYAWVDHPEGANLFNEEGLPASPFKARIKSEVRT